MLKTLAQPVITDDKGRTFIENDWNGTPLPNNIELDEMAYPGTSYSFNTFFSRQHVGFKLGYASGNYGHSIFTTGENGQINIGKFVVLEGTCIIANASVIIKDHCMLSWGSVVTDSWITDSIFSPHIRRDILKRASYGNRYLEFNYSKPVYIEENVWLGFGAVVLPGVHIGKGAVVGCKTIVDKDVPPYAVVIGNPARVIRYLNPTDTEELKRATINQFLSK
jgi:acetyltransferase-like isoleucine patch superfamily enzyme